MGPWKCTPAQQLFLYKVLQKAKDMYALKKFDEGWILLTENDASSDTNTMSAHPASA